MTLGGERDTSILSRRADAVMGYEAFHVTADWLEKKAIETMEALL